jgi:hypothetical protein
MKSFGFALFVCKKAGLTGRDEFRYKFPQAACAFRRDLSVGGTSSTGAGMNSFLQGV